MFATQEPDLVAKLEDGLLHVCFVSLDKSIQMCGEIVSVFVSATFCTKKGYLNISLQLDMGWLVL